MVAALIAAAAVLRIALLPCAPHGQAKTEEAAWLGGRLTAELGAKAALVPDSDVRAAMSSRGVESALVCDDSCLVGLGEALGADRVVGQTLWTKRKVQSPGVAWSWVLHQVDVRSKAPFGHFERTGVRPRTYWKTWAAEMAQKILSFDPKQRLRLDRPAEAAPPAGGAAAPGMVHVPAGDFVMGSEWGEPDEEPRHVVHVDAFFLDRYEVTNEEYERCVAAGKCPFQCVRDRKELMGPRQPVVCVNWFDAVKYCAFAGKRLPTEAEWEWAARGNDERRYPWGDEWRPERANTHGAEDGFAYTAPVASFPKNVSPFGAYDMAGNAWEWTQDYWDPTYYARSPRDNPKGPEIGKRRAMRGGSWMYDVPYFLESANRSPGWPARRKEYVGVRCAMDVPR